MIPLPETADAIAVAPVPFRPTGRKSPHLIAAFRNIPRLGDQLGPGQHRVLPDGVQKRGARIESPVEPLPRQRRGEIEAESVDPHFGHPVAQAVEHQPQDEGMGRVGSIAAPRVIPGKALGGAVETVVGVVVDPPERKRRPQAVPLGGMVIDHVENHLDARPVEILHHLLELADLLLRIAGGGIFRMGGEEAEGVVTPIIAQLLVDQIAVVDEKLDRQQLDGGDRQILEIGDRRLRAQGAIGPPIPLRKQFPFLGKAAHMRLVDHDVPHPPLRLLHPLPVEIIVDHHRLGQEGSAIPSVRVEIGVGVVRTHLVTEKGVVPAQLPGNRLGVGIEEQFRRIETMAFIRRMRPFHAQGVHLPRLQPGKKAMPDMVGAFRQPDPGHLRSLGMIEEADIDRRGMLGEDRELYSPSIPMRPEGIRATGFHAKIWHRGPYPIFLPAKVEGLRFDEFEI